MIVTREAVRAAVNRALALDPAMGDEAIQAAAQALGLPTEVVREVLSETEVTT